MTENSTASGSTAGSTQQVSLPTFTSHVPPPGRLELKGKLSDNWKKWKQVWDAYETVTKLNEKESKFRVATFITCIGAEVLEVHNGLLFRSEDDKQDINIVLDLWNSIASNRQILFTSVIGSITETKSLTNPSMFTLQHCELWQPRVNSEL